MTDPIHPARRMPFADLMAGLERARTFGFVHRRVSDAADLQLFIYTPKLDGSLIIVFHHGGRWRAATKGAFESEQAV